MSDSSSVPSATVVSSMIGVEAMHLYRVSPFSAAFRSSQPPSVNTQTSLVAACEMVTLSTYQPGPRPLLSWDRRKRLMSPIGVSLGTTTVNSSFWPCSNMSLWTCADLECECSFSAKTSVESAIESSMSRSPFALVCPKVKALQVMPCGCSASSLKSRSQRRIATWKGSHAAKGMKGQTRKT